MTGATALKMAATVILLRLSDSAEFEVLLTCSLSNIKLGGMVAFPGGPLQMADCSEAILARCHGVTPAAARRILGADLTPEAALGHWVAGIREVYEKTGILLAKPEQRNGRASATNTAGANGVRSLHEMKGLCCDAARLAYFSHWQTSELFSGFDTRFFLALMPEISTPLPTSGKVVHHFWMTPDYVLTLFGRGEFPMIFSTFASLRALADFDSLDSLIREYKLRVVS